MSFTRSTDLLCLRYHHLLRQQNQGEWLRDSRWLRRHTSSNVLGVIDFVWGLYSSPLPGSANRGKYWSTESSLEEVTGLSSQENTPADVLDPLGTRNRRSPRHELVVCTKSTTVL